MSFFNNFGAAVQGTANFLTGADPSSAWQDAARQFGVEDEYIKTVGDTKGAAESKDQDWKKIMDDFLNDLDSSASLMTGDAYMQRQAELLASQYAFNSLEAQKARAFSKLESEIARKWNAEQNDLAWARSQEASREANSFEAAQAELNRAWQERMSNTAIQRQTADYKAAGLNPYLAYAAGGAPVTSGGAASASMANVPTTSTSAAKSAQASGSAASAPNTGMEAMIASIVSSAIKAVGQLANK